MLPTIIDQQESNSPSQDTVNNSSSSLVVSHHGSDSKIRDIPKTSRGAVPSSLNSRLAHMIAHYFSSQYNSKGLRATDTIVKNEVNYLKQMSKTLYAYLVEDVANTLKMTIAEAVTVNWSAALSLDLQEKYILMLEKKAVKERGLDIGRCQDSWAGRNLLSLASTSINSVKSLQHYYQLGCKVSACSYTFYISSSD